MEKLFNHDNKPRGNGRGFLAYGASNCRRFREEAFDALADLAFELGMKVHADGKCWGLKHDEQKVDRNQLLNRCECRSSVGVFNIFVFCKIIQTDCLL